MLERLERGDRPAERVAILRVFGGELEHAVGGTDDLGTLQCERDLKLVLHRRGRATDLAHDRAAGTRTPSKSTDP